MLLLLHGVAICPPWRRFPEDFNPQWNRFRCLSKGQRLAYFLPCTMQRFLHQMSSEWKTYPECLDHTLPPLQRGCVKEGFSQMAAFRFSDKFSFRSASSFLSLVSYSFPETFFFFFFFLESDRLFTQNLFFLNDNYDNLTLFFKDILGIYMLLEIFLPSFLFFFFLFLYIYIFLN